MDDGVFRQAPAHSAENTPKCSYEGVDAMEVRDPSRLCLAYDDTRPIDRSDRHTTSHGVGNQLFGLALRLFVGILKGLANVNVRLHRDIGPVASDIGSADVVQPP